MDNWRFKLLINITKQTKSITYHGCVELILLLN